MTSPVARTKQFKPREFFCMCYWRIIHIREVLSLIVQCYHNTIRTWLSSIAKADLSCYDPFIVKKTRFFLLIRIC